MAKLPTRRAVALGDLDELIRDVEALRAGGYESAGRWNLAQVCHHLADWMEFPLDGFPRPLPLRPLFWTLRNTVGRRQLQKVLATRSMPDGLPTLRQTVPTPDGDESQAVERLRRTIERFRTHSGPFHPSPMFGALGSEQWTQLQLVHGAHHLGFLIPKS